MNSGQTSTADTAAPRLTDIAIVGGGLMGASTALLLAQVLPDCRITLLEKRPFALAPEGGNPLPSFDARSTALAPTSIELLKRLEVWPEVHSHATPIRTIQVSDQGHVGWVRLTESDNDGQPLGAVVENQALGRALIAAVGRAPGVEVIAPAEVVRAKVKTSGVELELTEDATQSKGSILAKLVIVADGVTSSLASQLGIGMDLQDYQQHAVIANVAYEQPHQCAAYERFTAQGPMALLPLGGNLSHTSALVWTWPSDQVESALTMPDDQFLTVLQRQFGHRLGRFTAVSRRSSYPLSLSVAKEQVRSRLVLLGNAAHFLHPVAGQGYNLALRDALRLSEVLRACPPDQLGELSSLLRYQQLQEDDQRRTIRLSDGFTRVFGSSHLAVMGLRNLGMMAVENSAWVRNEFVWQMSGRASRQANPWRTGAGSISSEGSAL